MDGVGVDWLAADAAANRSALAPARTAPYVRGDLPAGTASARTRSANSTSARRSLPTVRVALTETQTGLPTTRQAHQASYERGCNDGRHLEHRTLRAIQAAICVPSLAPQSLDRFPCNYLNVLVVQAQNSEGWRAVLSPWCT